MQEKDLLTEMFTKQAELNRRIGLDMENMAEEKQPEWILNFCRALTQEAAELTDCVPWKWWAKYQTYDKQNARVEVVDLFHFLISLAQILGMTAEDVHNLYMKKNKVNFERQDSGYAQKDESDNKDLTI